MKYTLKVKKKVSNKIRVLANDYKLNLYGLVNLYKFNIYCKQIETDSYCFPRILQLT
jgi:hypothetical protein